MKKRFQVELLNASRTHDFLEYHSDALTTELWRTHSEHARSKTTGSCGWHMSCHTSRPRDYQGKRMNPPYRAYIQGNPSWDIFRHGTQFFRRCYSRVAWMFSWRICLCRFVSFRRQGIPPTPWGFLLWYFNCVEADLAKFSYISKTYLKMGYPGYKAYMVDSLSYLDLLLILRICVRVTV